MWPTSLYGLECIVTVAAIGTASFVGMGFDAKGLTLVFLWLTAGLICLLAGVLTLHTLDLLLNERCRERRCRPCSGHRDTASHLTFLQSRSRSLAPLPCFLWCRLESASESYAGFAVEDLSPRCRLDQNSRQRLEGSDCLHKQISPLRGRLQQNLVERRQE